MKWKDLKITDLQKEIETHKGYGESKRFYQLREEIIEKVGKQEWEKMLYKTKINISKLKIKK